LINFNNRNISSQFEAEALLNNIKNSDCTSNRTPHFTIRKISWIRLFKEIIAVYCENDTKPTNTKYSVTICEYSMDI
jgi:hypothetical protein